MSNGNTLAPQIKKITDGMWVQTIRPFRYKGYWFRNQRKMRILDTLGGLCTVAVQRPLRNDQGYIDKTLTFPSQGWKYCLLMLPEDILANCKELPQDAP